MLISRISTYPHFMMHIRRHHLVPGQSSSLPVVYQSPPPNRHRILTHSAPDKQSLLLVNDADDNVRADDASPSELKTRSEQVPEKVAPKRDDADADCPPTTRGVDNGVGVGNHIKHIAGDVNADDLYALPNKPKVMQPTTTRDGDAVAVGTHHDCNIGGVGVVAHQVNESTSADEDDDGDNDEKGKVEEVEDKDASKDLPPGWEKHEGETFDMRHTFFDLE